MEESKRDRTVAAEQEEEEEEEEEDEEKATARLQSLIADAALQQEEGGRTGTKGQGWTRMQMGGGGGGGSKEDEWGWRHWWDAAGGRLASWLDAASERFNVVDRRRLVLGLAGVLLVVGVALNVLNRDDTGASADNSGFAGFGHPGPQGHLPSSLRRKIMGTRQAALRLKQQQGRQQQHGLLLAKGSQSGGGGGGPTGDGVEDAYQPLATRAEIVRDGGIDFIVSTLEGPRPAKPQALSLPSPSSGSTDPFAEGNRDSRLVVMDFGPGHVLMLNKFPSMQDHLLLVTKDFQPQSGLLSATDLHALWRLVKEVPAVGFFNSGLEAGASQSHRHLQAVPLDVLQSYNPLTPQPVPMSALVEEAMRSAPSPASSSSSSFRVPALPFQHRVFRLPDDPSAQELEGLYHRLLERIGYHQPSSSSSVATAVTNPQEGPAREDEEDGSSSSSYSGSTAGGDGQQSSSSVPAYNLVMTSRWLLAVPRTQREYLGVDVNAMGFFGALLARDAATLDVIKRVRPFNILRGVVPATVGERRG